MRRQRQLNLTLMADAVQARLPDQLRRAMMVAREKGASSTLTTIPVAEHGFFFDVKSDFHDHVHLRYCWPIDNLPSVCACGTRFTVHHAQICKLAGFILSTCAMMTPPTSWPSVCGRCTTTSRWSHHCCPSLVKRSAAAPPTHNQMLVQTSVCEASGLIAERHFLTRGCFIPTRRAISPEAYHLSSALSRMRRSVSTGNGSPRWSMAASHRWCFLPVEEWVRRPLWSLRSWRAP